MLTDERKTNESDETRQSYLVSLFRTSAFSLAIINELRFLSIGFKTNEINVQRKKVNKLKIKATIVEQTRVCSFAARNERNENWRTFEPFISVCVARSPHTLFRFPLSCCARLFHPDCTKCETMCSRNEDRRVYFERLSILCYLLLRQSRKCLRESASCHAHPLTDRPLSLAGSFSLYKHVRAEISPEKLD